MKTPQVKRKTQEDDRGNDIKYKRIFKCEIS